MKNVKVSNRNVLNNLMGFLIMVDILKKYFSSNIKFTFKVDFTN